MVVENGFNMRDFLTRYGFEATIRGILMGVKPTKSSPVPIKLVLVKVTEDTDAWRKFQKENK